MSASVSHSGSEMSASGASHSGTDSNSNAPNATAVKAEMESEGKKTHVRTAIKAELQTALKNWSASSVIKLNAAESEREYKLTAPPEWECIICNKPINTTPVYQCQSGHLACYSCSQKGINCHSCSKAVSRIRNLAVEKIIKSLVVTCKFAKLGCNEVMEFKELKYSKPEDNCSFKPMFCPMPGCKHAGVKNLFPQHLLSEHNISSLVDVGELKNPYTCSYYTDYTKEFDLDSSTALVMLRNMHFQEFHLLHHQCTAMGDRLEITSLAKSCKRKYELAVKVSEELTYCYKSVSTSNLQPTGGLLIPKQSHGDTLKKRCKVTMRKYS